jgi:hypothetical protein
MTDKPTVTGTGRTYFASVVTARRIASTGEVCGHTHRAQETAANCARRIHKRLTKGAVHSPLRAFTVKVGADGVCETPVPAGVAL